jgi:hypothetical protein
MATGPTHSWLHRGPRSAALPESRRVLDNEAVLVPARVRLDGAQCISGPVDGGSVAQLVREFILRSGWKWPNWHCCRSLYSHYYDC